MDRHDALAAYDRASRRLLGLIRGERCLAGPDEDRHDRARARLTQTRALLQALGDPQRRYPIVHVTGTSGKGSVAAMIAAMLTAAGYRVGLRTSPYLQVATEKLEVGSRLIDAHSLDRVSARVIAAQQALLPNVQFGYPEAWSALTFHWFAEEDVDLAVIEVGAGGRFDSTNVFDPVVSVITSVGLDHTTSLGPTIAEIAWHKAGIIKMGATAVVGEVPEAAREVIRREASRVGAPVIDAQAPPPMWGAPVAMPGAFQAANAGVATAAVEALRGHDFTVSEDALAAGLANARLPGRLERMPDSDEPVVWLDGAHNADKIAALVGEARLVSAGGPPPVVVLGVLKSKDAAAIAAGITPLAAAIVATEPTVTGRTALTAHELAATIRATGFTGALHAAPDALSALRHAEMLARSLGSHVLVTGSMYLVGQVRGRWYPDEEVVVQRTPWPARRAETDQALPERSVAL